MTLKVRQDRGARRKTLHVEGAEPDEAIVRRYVDYGCTAVVVGFRLSADFVRLLPGLEEVSLLRGVDDTSAVFEVSTLRALSMSTDYRGPSGCRDCPTLSSS
jgi:hypothetical protein